MVDSPFMWTTMQTRGNRGDGLLMLAPARPLLPDGDRVLFPVAALKDAGIIQSMSKKIDILNTRT